MESRRPRLPLQASAPVPVYIFFLLPVLYSALTTLRLPQIVHGFLLKIHAVQMVHQPVHKPVQRDNCSPPELSDLLRSATGNMAVYLLSHDFPTTYSPVPALTALFQTVRQMNLCVHIFLKWWPDKTESPHLGGWIRSGMLLPDLPHLYYVHKGFHTDVLLLRIRRLRFCLVWYGIPLHVNESCGLLLRYRVTAASSAVLHLTD